MSNEIGLFRNRVCEGRELKPKSGATFANTWVFGGKEVNLALKGIQQWIGNM